MFKKNNTFKKYSLLSALVYRHWKSTKFLPISTGVRSLISPGVPFEFPLAFKIGVRVRIDYTEAKIQKKTLNYLSSEIRKETRMWTMKTEAKIDEISNHEAKIVLKMTFLPFFRSRKFMRRILELSGF